jgi:hypothetical protein
MVSWRSLSHYTRRMLACDLISLPSEISTLGYFQEDVEEYLGVYVTEDMATDVRYTVDVMEDVWYTEDMMEDVFDAVDPY